MSKSDRLRSKLERFTVMYGLNRCLSVEDVQRTDRQYKAALDRLLDNFADKPCSSCGKRMDVMHTVRVHDEMMRLCDDCCPADLKRDTVPQEIVDILTKD